MKSKESAEILILGADEKCRFSTDSRKTQLNNNIAVVGGSGSGKTTSVVIPNLLRLSHGNAVGVFTKLGMINEISQVLANRGYRVHTVNFVEPSKSRYGYDPLFHCRTDADLKALAQAIIHESPGRNNQTQDPYWNNSAEGIVLPVLRHVKNGHYKGGRSMLDALELLDTLAVKRGTDVEDTWDFGYRYGFGNEAEEKKKEAERKAKEDEIYKLHKEFEHLEKTDAAGAVAWKTFVKLSEVTASCIASSVQTPLQGMFLPEIRQILAKKQQFDFRELLQPKTALFVYTSPVNMAYSRFLGIFYQQLFKTLFEMAERQTERRLPHPVQVFCDDFATGCHIPDFPNLISIFREKEISSVLLLQSETQLASMYGEFNARTILNNCDTYLYMGGMDFKTCENVALRLNRPIADVLSMPIGSEVLFRRGQKPIITQRYDLFTDPVYLREVCRKGKKRGGRSAFWMQTSAEPNR